MKPNMVRAQMALHNDTLESLAAKMGTTSRTLGDKINEKVPWKLDELVKFKAVYNLSADEMDDIFF